MAKAKWGTKRTCPKCGTRFYDLGKDNPVVCIECKHEWVPEPVLKSRQPQPEEEKPAKKPEPEAAEAETEELLEGEEIKEGEAIEEIELEDEEDVTGVIPPKKAGESE